jgi:hypothetical protein
MDFSKIMEELQNASLFDLYRLSVAINQKLENPVLLSEIKKKLKPGQAISYFDETENRLIDAKIIKVMRKRLLVRHIDDGRKWDIPLYYVNLDNKNTDIIGPSGAGLDKSQLKVGDMVGFQDNQNNDLNGNIIRLNQKTATIKTTANTIWRVAYEFLYMVIEVNQGQAPMIEGRIIDDKDISDR